MACTYHVVCQCYETKGWEHNNRWIENSDGLPMTEDWDDTFKERFHSIHSELKVEMKQMIDANLGVISSQEVEAQASELDLDRNRKQAARIIEIEKEGEFEREFDAQSFDLDAIFSHDDDCNGRYSEALYETRCGYYDREEEIENDEIFKKRLKQQFMEIKEYSEMEMWNPNTGRRYIFDEDDFYGNYYDEIWNIDEGFELYYQRYMQEQQQHVLQMEQL